MELLIALVIVILVFALIGFINSLIWLFTPSQTSQTPPASSEASKPSILGDVRAARRLFGHLRANNKIDEASYKQIRALLDQQFSAQSSSVETEKASFPTAPADGGIQISSPGQSPAAGQSDPTIWPPTKALSKSDADEPVGSADTGDNPFVIEAEIVEDVASNEATKGVDSLAGETSIEPEAAQIANAGSALSPASTLADSSEKADKPAPWDMPDPPARQPRKTFGELMSGFMQEKNMRWGELTSGILIVLSAVGLVVSLREELSDTIPYFSALLFMLMTAAIHGAGIYTLKKWKLRNTSRGTLIIGLLLVPLNFVAACILSSGEERRALNDPWLWAAIGIGVTAFTAMTWWSSKALLRRGHWPLTVAVMGSGIGTLLINRLTETATTSLGYLFYGLPVLGSFLVGTCLLDRRQWIRQRWSERVTNRMFLFLGVSSFALVVSLAMVVIRADAKAVGVVSLAPIFSVVFIITSWIGSIAHQGAEGKSKQSQRIAGLTLKIMGLILVGISLISSLSNPTIFVANSMLSSIALMAMFFHQKEEKLHPIAWAVLATGILALINVVTGTFGFDAWATRSQLAEALFNGKSGLCLLVVGAGVGLVNASLKRFVDAEGQKHFLLRGWVTGGAIFLVGCLVALVASFIHRDNVFDVMTATALLGIAAIGLIAVSLVIARRGESDKLNELPHFAAAVLIGSLWHAFLWNPTISRGVESATGNIDAGWVAMVAIASLVLVGLGVFLKRQRIRFASGIELENLVSKRATLSFGDQFADWGAGATIVLSLGSLLLIHHQTGWGSAFQVAACLSWLGVGWVWFYREENYQRIAGMEFRKFASVAFELSTGVLLGVVIAELVSRMDWCPTVAHSKHWLIQFAALSIWVIAWTVLKVGFDRSRHLKWISDSSMQIEKFVLYGLLFGIGGFVCDAMFGGTFAELVSDSQVVSQFSIQSEPAWSFMAMGAIAVALMVTTFVAPTVSLGAALILIWMLAYAFGATFFEESKSVASALRWLLPIAGIVGAGLATTRKRMFPAWVAARNKMSLSGPSRWSASSSQQLINFALAIVAGVVLLISTVTVSQVLLNGAAALGGPLAGSWFKRMPVEVSFGAPIGIIVTTFLIYAISERRSVLATLGSLVFQYIVALAVVMLFLSPHRKIATSWFINILQSVSLCMTCYGFVWYWKRARIGSKRRTDDQSVWYVSKLINQIEAHTLINGLLVTSMAVLVMGRFFLVPDQPGGWISSVGSLLGVIAWALFGGLAFCIWSEKLIKQGSLMTWSWLVGWMGLILVGLSAAVVDQNTTANVVGNGLPRLPFKLVALGAIVVAAIQTGLIAFLGRQNLSWLGSDHHSLAVQPTSKRRERPFSIAIPVLVVGGIGLLFAVRGALLDPVAFWFYIAICAALLLTVVSIGWLVRSSAVGFVAAGLTVLISALVVWQDPEKWFTQTQPYIFNLSTASLGVLAIVWTAFYLYRRKSKFEPIARPFLWMPNAVLLAGSIWILAAAIFQLACDEGVNASTLVNPLGIAALVAFLILSVVMVFNDRAKFQVISGCLLSLALAIVVASRLATNSDWRISGVAMAGGLIVALWGFVWLKRHTLQQWAKQMGATRLVALKRAASRQLPIYSLVLGSLVLLTVLAIVTSIQARPQRYLAALTPFALAVGFGCQSNQSGRRWLQLMTLSLVTFGSLLVAWADLDPRAIWDEAIVRVQVRGLIVMAAAMFIYGGLVTRWVREGDSWLKSLRQMAMATCGLAIAFFVLVIANEYAMFEEGVGCGLSIPEAVMVTILVVGMIVGLVTIAVRPENDPFALSLSGRMGYVYAAEFVGVALIAHMYFSMPWLFQIGIKDYWPFIVMVVCFAGVGVGQVLEKRNLTVLGQPIFHTAAVLPLLVAAAMMLVDSKADSALVLLTIGMIYLVISLMHGSILSGVGSVIFGNLALWVFFHRSPGFSFLDHPQLWLIPPAISTLIAGQLSRKSLDAKQLATLRYICVAVIYMSSTIEIFIAGVGQNLWPPVVLAVLSVIGIMSGIMLQIKSFLYFGSLFLLMAMITMVAHAHQRLDHVWPWWAFGVVLGISILVMFGLFEKRKKEMKAIAFRLKDWEA